MDFFSARKYRHDILLRRIRELMRLTEAEDPRVSREIAEQLLKTGGGLLLFICAANGLALAMPLWLLALLWVAAAVGLGYMSFFAPESNRTKAFRAGFFALLISSAILAVIIRTGLAGMH